jgi:hypothetical protein
MIEPPYSDIFISKFLKILFLKKTLDSLDKNLNILSNFLCQILENYSDLIKEEELIILNNILSKNEENKIKN